VRVSAPPARPGLGPAPVEPRIRELLQAYPTVPATAIAERIESPRDTPEPPRNPRRFKVSSLGQRDTCVPGLSQVFPLVTPAWDSWDRWDTESIVSVPGLQASRFGDRHGVRRPAGTGTARCGRLVPVRCGGRCS